MLRRTSTMEYWGGEPSTLRIRPIPSTSLFNRRARQFGETDILGLTRSNPEAQRLAERKTDIVSFTRLPDSNTNKCIAQSHTTVGHNGHALFERQPTIGDGAFLNHAVFCSGRIDFAPCALYGPCVRTQSFSVYSGENAISGSSPRIL